MNNAVLLLDIAIRALNVNARIQEMLQTAQMEGRDITDEELTALRNATNDLFFEWYRE